MKSRAHIFVSGRVQGVFFRAHVQRWASSMNCKGWIKNLYDGRVESLVEGEKEKIVQLIEKMKEGPPLVRVENIEVNWQKYKGEFYDFRISW